MAWIFWGVPMRSASLAEWILRCCTSRSRAASIVGDLVELRPQKGLFWFWISLAGAVMRLLWRPALALVAAFYASNWVFSIFQTTLWGAHSLHHIPVSINIPGTNHAVPAEILFRILVGAGESLWLILVYSALRHSTLDPSTQLAAALTAATTALVFLWWQILALVGLLLFLVVVLSVFLLSRIRRNALVTVLASVLVSSSGFMLSLLLATVWQEFLKPRPWGGQDMDQHPSVLWVAFCLMLSAAWVTTATYSALRNHFSSDRLHGDTASKLLSQA
jgi:hypothetical protein